MLQKTLVAGLIALALVWISSPVVAQKTPQCITDRIVVPLDDSGIADWRFLNPRRPYPLIRQSSFGATQANDSCWTPENLKKVEIVFQNRTSDRSFNVEIAFEIKPPTGEAFELLDLLSLNVAERRLLSARKPDGALEEEISVYQRLIESEKGKIENTTALKELRRKELELVQSQPVTERSKARLHSLATEIATLEQEIGDSQRKKEQSEIYKEQLEAQLSPRAGTGGVASRDVLDLYASYQKTQESLRELEEQREQVDKRLLLLRLETPGSRDQEIKAVEDDLTKLETKVSTTRSELRRAEAKLLLKALATLSENERSLIETELLLSSGQERLDWLAERLNSTGQANGAEISSAQKKLEKAMDECRGAFQELKGKTLPTLAQLSKVGKECFEKDGKSEIPTRDASSVAYLIATESELGWAKEPFARLEKAFAKFREIESYIRRSQSTAEELGKGCKSLPSGNLRCTRFLNIGGRGRGTLEGGFAELIKGKGLATFKVSFSGEAEIPSNSKGYLRTDKDLTPPDNDSKWTFSGSTGYTRDPELPGKDDDGNDLNLTPDEPYMGDARRRLPGSASLKLKQTLGNRAEGSATFGFKSGSLGEADQSNDVKVTDYQINVFGENGFQLRFGKYKFLSSIGANPKGEGFEFYYRGFSGGLILERESLEGIANDADQDARAAFFQVENFGFGADTPILNRFDLFAVWGEDEKPENENEFWTAGLRGYYVVPFDSSDWSLSGALEATLSDRKRGAQADEKIRDGRGTSWLLSLEAVDIVEGKEDSKSAKPGETERTLSLRVGHGDGDDPDTADRDEGFLGDSASFAPDKIFIKRLAPEIRDERGNTFPGLTNKTYFGLSYEDRTFSPLTWPWSLLNPKEKIVSRSTKISYHRYRFDEPVYGERKIGSELDVDFSVQAPKGVTFSLGFAWFFPDDATDPFFPNDDPWLIDAKVSLDL